MWGNIVDDDLCVLVYDKIFFKDKKFTCLINNKHSHMIEPTKLGFHNMESPLKDLCNTLAIGHLVK